MKIGIIKGVFGNFWVKKEAKNRVKGGGIFPEKGRLAVLGVKPIEFIKEKMATVGKVDRRETGLKLLISEIRPIVHTKSER